MTVCKTDEPDSKNTNKKVKKHQQVPLNPCEIKDSKKRT